MAIHALRFTVGLSNELPALLHGDTLIITGAPARTLQLFDDAAQGRFDNIHRLTRHRIALRAAPAPHGTPPYICSVFRPGFCFPLFSFLPLFAARRHSRHQGRSGGTTPPSSAAVTKTSLSPSRATPPATSM